MSDSPATDADKIKTLSLLRPEPPQKKDDSSKNKSTKDETDSSEKIIFEDYIDRYEAYSNIVKEIMERMDWKSASSLSDLMENGKWTPISDDRQITGLMSICPTLSSILSFDIDLLNESLFDETKKKKSNCQKYYREILRMIQFIRDQIRGDGRSYVYDLSPYVVNQSFKPEFDDKTKITFFDFKENGSYIGSICWVAEALIKTYTLATTMGQDKIPLLKLRPVKEEEMWNEKYTPSQEYNPESHEEVLEDIRTIIQDCVGKVTEYSIITGEGKDAKSAGWTYTKPDPGDKLSLYHTYRVADLWLNIFKCLGEQYYSFRDFENAVNEYIVNCDNGEFNDYCKGNYWEERTFNSTMESILNNPNGRSEQKANRNRVFKSIQETIQKGGYDNERISFMFRLNGGYPITNTAGNFAKLKKYLLDVSWQLWEGCKDTMSSQYFYSDLSIVPADAFGKGGQSDILFNTLFMQGIMVSGALDIELKKMDDLDSDNRTSNRYKKFLDVMESSLQNTLDTYTRMRRDGSAYKVEKYIVSLDNEDANSEYSKLIRRSNIIGHSLIPLLTKINSLLSEYIVRYPQKQMKNYLSMILDNSLIIDEEAKWIWDRDGFASSLNYYYSNALVDFYTYYEEYERKYLTNSKKLEKIEKTQKNEIIRLNDDLKQKDAIIKDLESEKTALEDKITSIEEKNVIASAIRSMIREEIERTFMNRISMMSEFYLDKEKRKNTLSKEENEILEKFSEAMVYSFVQWVVDNDSSYKSRMIIENGLDNNENKDEEIYKRLVNQLANSVKGKEGRS